MHLNQELYRIANAKNDIKNAIANKGIHVNENEKLTEYSNIIEKNIKQLQLNYYIKLYNENGNLIETTTLADKHLSVRLRPIYSDEKFRNATIVMDDRITNMSGAFLNGGTTFQMNVHINPFCGNGVTNMANTYYQCRNLTGSPVCGDNVVTMFQTYYYCTNLTGSPVCGENVTNMGNTYQFCRNLTGSPVCGDNVINMFNAYQNCSNLTGSPVCGNNVYSMKSAYQGCVNLTGSPVCGNNVYSMTSAYHNCYNLTGSPVCGNKVAFMNGAYRNCYNLTGNPICGEKVVNVAETYYGCINIGKNGYFYSSEITNANNCFVGRNVNKRLNLYVPANSNTLNTCLISDAMSLVGEEITWTNQYDTNGYYYNTAYNIYIYPVENIINIRTLNGD